MRVIIVNYRFFIAGGPERYMFNFMAAAERMGIEVIPFSVQNPQNKKTAYASYFAKPIWYFSRHSLESGRRAAAWETDSGYETGRRIYSA